MGGGSRVPLVGGDSGVQFCEVLVADDGNWIDQPGSRVSALKDGPRMLAHGAVPRWRLAGGRGPRRTP